MISERFYQRGLYLPALHGRRQEGIATILTVIAIGIATTAIALALMHSVRSTQEKQIATHASTHSQNSVWIGVEAFRRYLMTLDDATILALSNQQSINIGVSAIYGTLDAHSFAITPLAAGEYKVEAVVQSNHTAAKSSTSLGVVFQLSTSSDIPSVELAASLNFLDDLNVNGEITFNTPAGTKADINVKGNVSITNITVSPLGSVTSTGTVDINSGVTIEEIFANDSVTITQSAKVDLVRTKGDLTTEGGGYITTAWVDGNITSTTNGSNAAGFTSEQWNAIGFIDVGSGKHKYMKTGGTLDIDYVNGMTNAESVGNVTITNNGANITDLITEGTITCTKGGPNFTRMSANKTSSGCKAGVTTNANPPHDVIPMQPNPTYAVPEFTVDVWPLKPYANYVFERNVSGVITVTVNKVKGVTDGTLYYLGNYVSSDNTTYKKSFLCTAEPDSNGNCTADTVTDIAVCIGNGSPYYNACLEYRSTGKLSEQGWQLVGKATAPGVMWFDGNVNVGVTHAYTTILASGDITTSGSLYLKSVNYAGYDPVCDGKPAEITDSFVKAKYQEFFQNQYPTNFCDKSKPEYTPSSLGNMAFAAGGYAPDGNNTYAGGYINLAQSTEVFGSVLAGSILKSFGGIKVHGYITAAALNTADVLSDDNVLDGSTTIDLTNYPSTYDPTKVPDMSVNCTSNCAGNSEGAKVLWSRYL